MACKGGTANCSNTSTAANQYGVMVSAGVPAWTATAGYDLATGLGTVNVANLAAAWAGVGLTASTTTISASPGGTIAHGANASFTVNVASSGGTPTGQVSLIATPAGAAQTGIGPFSLTGGTAAFTTNMLPGGTAYNVVAHYSGDGTFAQSDSAPVLVTVSKESSKTSVALVTFDASNNITSSNATTAPYGSPYIMRVDVTNASATACSANLNNGTIPPIDTIPCPTGNVTVTDNGSPLNDFTISNTGVASNVAPLNRQGLLRGSAHSIARRKPQHRGRLCRRQQLYLQHLRRGCHLHHQGGHRRGNDPYSQCFGELPHRFECHRHHRQFRRRPNRNNDFQLRRLNSRNSAGGGHGR